MARSINQRQESYIKVVHLENLGSGRNDFEAVELEPIEQALADLATLFADTAEKELNVKQAIATGKLAESIQWDRVKYLGGVYSVDINVLDYYKWINKGVSGTENKTGGEYSFKNNRVSKSMMFAIRKWIIRNGLKANVKEVKAKNGKYALGREKKTMNLANTSNSMAYAIATSIKKKGIKPTHFWDKAQTTVEKEIENSLGNAFAIAVVNEIAR
jgi:hypothetical protein